MDNRCSFNFNGVSADIPGPDQGVLNGIWIALTVVGTAAATACIAVFVKKNW